MAELPAVLAAVGVTGVSSEPASAFLELTPVAGFMDATFQEAVGRLPRGVFLWSVACEDHAHCVVLDNACQDYPPRVISNDLAWPVTVANLERSRLDNLAMAKVDAVCYAVARAHGARGRAHGARMAHSSPRPCAWRLPARVKAACDVQHLPHARA